MLLACLALAGCDSGEEDSGSQPPRSPAELAATRLIGDWLGALNAGEYERAAGFFARGAIVDQGRPIRLPDRAAARFFNATLPCRADLSGVRDEAGPRALATFRLRTGPADPAKGRPGALHDSRRQVHEVAPAGGRARANGPFSEPGARSAERGPGPGAGQHRGRRPGPFLDPAPLLEPVVASQLGLAGAPLLVRGLGRHRRASAGAPSSSSATIVR